SKARRTGDQPECQRGANSGFPEFSHSTSLTAVVIVTPSGFPRVSGVPPITNGYPSLAIIYVNNCQCFAYGDDCLISVRSPDRLGWRIFPYRGPSPAKNCPSVRPLSRRTAVSAPRSGLGGDGRRFRNG